MKYLIMFFFSCCLTVSYCSAQELDEDPVAGTGNKPRPIQNLIAVTFISNDTCNLVINGKDYGEVPGNTPKTIRLFPGYHRLFFESLETGEAIKQRAFLLTKDSAKGGKYTFPVTFKQN